MTWRQAGRHLRDFRPGLIVAGYVLPGFSGEDALRAAARVCPSVPIIIVSGMLGEDLAVDSVVAAARLRLQAERAAALERARLSEDRLR
jgi:DNA-binding NtrC family response regulator